MSPQRILSVALLVVLLVGVFVLKQRLDYGLGKYANDADYYYTIARSVSEGDGLQSNLSLYYQGFKELPHRVTTSPVWPLTLGAVGAVVGLGRASYGLPLALYLLDVVLLFVLARRLHRAIAPDAGSWLGADSPIGIGWIAAFVLATNAVFFQFTYVPNNEAMAFALIFASLLCVDRAARASAARWAFAAGLLGGLALLTRVQALGATVAILLGFGLLAWRHADARRLPWIALAGTLLPFVPWVAWLASWNERIPLGALLGQDTQRETPELTPFAHSFVPESAWAFLLDRLKGLGVAFDWRSPESYVSHFGGLAYLVPLALLLLAWRFLRADAGERLALPRERVLPIVVVLAGLGMLLPVHAAHVTFYFDWLFGFRHGLPLVLLIVPAIAFLDAQRAPAWRVLAGVVVASALVTNVLGLQALFDRKLKYGLNAGERQLVEWVGRQRPLPTLVTTQPWMFGAFSRAGYHWILCRHSADQTLKLLRLTGADYVVVRHGDQKCGYIDGIVPDELVRVIAFRHNLQVYALRERLGPNVLRMIESGGQGEP